VAASEAQQKLEELHATLNADLEKARRELNEMDTLLRQTNSEVEKLAQRELTVANRLRDLEVNLDKYSKADVKNFYTSAQEVQMRLLMMRGQLEQLQFRQQAWKARQSQLFEIATALEPLIGAEVGGGGGGRGGLDDGGDMIASIIQAQEKERLRISLQMHDGPAQSMSNLVLRAEICQRLLDRDLDQARAELSGLKSAINTTLQDTRRFIFECCGVDGECRSRWSIVMTWIPCRSVFYWEKSNESRSCTTPMRVSWRCSRTASIDG